MLRMSSDKLWSLKLRYKASILAALFSAYVLAAGLSVGFAALSARALDISLQDPVRDQPQGLLWAVLFFAFLVIALVSCGIGMLTLLTRAWAKRYGWSPEQTKRVFWKSELPQEWFKPTARRSPGSGWLP